MQRFLLLKPKFSCWKNSEINQIFLLTNFWLFKLKDFLASSSSRKCSTFQSLHMFFWKMSEIYLKCLFSNQISTFSNWGNSLFFLEIFRLFLLLFFLSERLWYPVECLNLIVLFPPLSSAVLQRQHLLLTGHYIQGLPGLPVWIRCHCSESHWCFHLQNDFLPACGCAAETIKLQMQFPAHRRQSFTIYCDLNRFLKSTNRGLGLGQERSIKLRE